MARGTVIYPVDHKDALADELAKHGCIVTDLAGGNISAPTKKRNSWKIFGFDVAGPLFQDMQEILENFAVVMVMIPKDGSVIPEVLKRVKLEGEQ